MKSHGFKWVRLVLWAGLAIHSVYAAKLAEVRVLDREYVMVRVLDGEVTHRDDGLGAGAYLTINEVDADTVKHYTPILSTSAAGTASNWTIKSATDSYYGTGTGRAPSAVHRKTKLNGHAQKAWAGSDYNYEKTYEHVLYLRLPQAMVQGAAYTLEINAATQVDLRSASFSFDENSSVSEAIHVNLVAYDTTDRVKSADLYAWMGDGGARNYTAFQGNKVYLYNTQTSQRQEVGQVSFWKNSASDVGGYNLSRSNVWNVDFTGHNTPGTYRLVVEGVGCSPEFKIEAQAYQSPFLVSVRGFYYMRIGQDSTPSIRPVPRRPLYIPGVSPANTTVYLTTLHPYHANWTSFSGGSDPWDKKDEWAAYKKADNSTNPRAKGGHSDALDWDRHLGHISIIYDMLLPYILTRGNLNDDNLGITESGNGIPDLLDEARNEVDFWLNLRDGAAYAHGLNNPNATNVFYQAGPTAVAAWANAANAAMLAECFRISGHSALMAQYRDSAVVAYNFANGLADPMLNNTQGIGDAVIRGRDLKMMAAAYLYNVTGTASYEQDMAGLSAVTSPSSEIHNDNTMNQVWAVAGYIMTPRTVNQTTLFNNMKSAIISEAKTKESNQRLTRPSRRSTPNGPGYFRTAQNLHRTMIAHAVTTDATEKAAFADALILEADYGLGRNAANVIQMTTQTTPLATKRSIEGLYTSGRDDGSPGMHPGHTPYMNLDDWDTKSDGTCRMEMGCPSRLYSAAYPANFKTTWPADEGYFNSRYVWAHGEFTPQQTMRGKMALYGYLHGLSKGNEGPTIKVNAKRNSYYTQIQIGNHMRRVPAGLYRAKITDLQGRTLWSNPHLDLHQNQSVDFKPTTKGVYLITLQGNGERIGFREVF